MHTNNTQHIVNSCWIYLACCVSFIKCKSECHNESDKRGTWNIGDRDIVSRQFCSFVEHKYAPIAEIEAVFFYLCSISKINMLEIYENNKGYMTTKQKNTECGKWGKLGVQSL